MKPFEAEIRNSVLSNVSYPRHLIHRFLELQKKEGGLRKPFNALYNKTTTLKPPMVMLEGIKVPSRTRPAQPER